MAHNLRSDVRNASSHSPEARVATFPLDDCIETHISQVYLSDRFAFKRKKPVHFDYLDFRTSQQRKAACEAEVHLNRRLAPHVYLGVCPCWVDGNQLHVADATDARLLPADIAQRSDLDWCVKMRKLPQEKSLQHLISSGLITSDQMRRLANVLVQFYTSLPPETLKTEDYVARFAQHVQSNIRELDQYTINYSLDQYLWSRVRSAQQRFLQLESHHLESRVIDGRIVNGHGDLRPEHIYFLPNPVVIDCIEFNSEYRTIDVQDELSFLAMECDRLGAPDLVEPVLEACCAATHDQIQPRLYWFYRIYRACVRAKVAIRSPGGSHANPEVLAYLKLAASYASRLYRPLFVVVSGPSGSGKTSIAHTLANQLGLIRLSTDDIRRTHPQIPSEARYRPTGRQRIYDAMFQQAREFAGRQVSVVLDGTFGQQQWRDAARSLAAEFQADFLFIHCDCPLRIRQKRVELRQSAQSDSSEIAANLLEKQQAEFAPLPSDFPSVRLDTSEPIHVCVHAIYRQLGRSRPAQPAS